MGYLGATAGTLAAVPIVMKTKKSSMPAATPAATPEPLEGVQESALDTVVGGCGCAMPACNMRMGAGRKPGWR